MPCFLGLGKLGIPAWVTLAVLMRPCGARNRSWVCRTVDLLFTHCTISQTYQFVFEGTWLMCEFKFLCGVIFSPRRIFWKATSVGVFCIVKLSAAPFGLELEINEGALKSLMHGPHSQRLEFHSSEVSGFVCCWRLDYFGECWSIFFLFLSLHSILKWSQGEHC